MAINGIQNFQNKDLKQIRLFKFLNEQNYYFYGIFTYYVKFDTVELADFMIVVYKESNIINKNLTIKLVLIVRIFAYA